MNLITVHGLIMAYAVGYVKNYFGRLRSDVGTLAGAADAGFVVLGEALLMTNAASTVGKARSTMERIAARGRLLFGAIAGGHASGTKLALLRARAGGLQVEIDLAVHADAGTIARGEATLTTNPADFFGLAAPAPEGDMMDRARRNGCCAHGYLIADREGFVNVPAIGPHSQRLGPYMQAEHLGLPLEPTNCKGRPHEHLVGATFPSARFRSKLSC